MKLGKLNFGVAFILAATCVSAQPGEIQVQVNGQPVVFSGTQPVMIGSRVLVPLRGVFEQMGAYVQWNPWTHTVTATQGSLDVELQPGSSYATVNGERVALDTPAQIVGGSTMVPLRFMAEGLNADVQWSAGTDTVAITTANSAAFDNSQANSESGSGALVIRDFLHSGTGWYGAGKTIHFIMHGTPGGSAVVYVPGVTGDIPMQETSAGTYEANWTPDANGQAVSVSNAVALARLTVGSHSQVIQARTDLSVDTEPPMISDRYPAPDITVAALRPDIRISYVDAGSGVDLNGFRLIFNGVDVTKQTTVGKSYAEYIPDTDLPPGKYEVKAHVPDLAGNVSESDWTFSVIGTHTASSFSHSMGGTIQVGDTATFDLQAQPGSRVYVSVGSASDIPLAETSPGFFHGSYVIQPTDMFDNDAVTAHIVAPNGEAYEVVAPQRTSVLHGVVAGPVFVTPLASVPIISPLVVSGTARPNARVHIHVEYETSPLGALRVHGDLIDTTVQADDQGHFQSRPISLDSFVKGTNTVYNITAFSYYPDGSQTSVTTLTIRQ